MTDEFVDCKAPTQIGLVSFVNSQSQNFSVDLVFIPWKIVDNYVNATTLLSRINPRIAELLKK